MRLVPEFRLEAFICKHVCSQYNHERRRKKTTATSFEEAVMPEYTIIKRCHEQDEWMANQGKIDEVRCIRCSGSELSVLTVVMVTC